MAGDNAEPLAGRHGALRTSGRDRTAGCARLLVAALIPPLVMATAGCGSSSDTTRAASSASTKTTASTSSQQTPATKGVGSSITIPAGGTKLAITVVKVIDP